MRSAETGTIEDPAKEPSDSSGYAHRMSVPFEAPEPNGQEGQVAEGRRDQCHAAHEQQCANSKTAIEDVVHANFERDEDQNSVNKSSEHGKRPDPTIHDEDFRFHIELPLTPHLEECFRLVAKSWRKNVLEKAFSESFAMVNGFALQGASLEGVSPLGAGGHGANARVDAPEVGDTRVTIEGFEGSMIPAANIRLRHAVTTFGDPPRDTRAIDLDAETILRRSMAIAADICVYTNGNLTIESLEASA